MTDLRARSARLAFAPAAPRLLIDWSTWCSSRVATGHAASSVYMQTAPHPCRRCARSAGVRRPCLHPPRHGGYGAAVQGGAVAADGPPHVQPPPHAVHDCPRRRGGLAGHGRRWPSTAFVHGPAAAGGSRRGSLSLFDCIYIRECCSSHAPPQTLHPTTYAPLHIGRTAPRRNCATLDPLPRRDKAPPTGCQSTAVNGRWPNPRQGG